jgi:putative DNA primase/helicase
MKTRQTHLLQITDARIRNLREFITDLIVNKAFGRNKAWKLVEKRNIGSKNPIDKSSVNFYFKKFADEAEQKLAANKRDIRSAADTSSNAPSPEAYADDVLAREFSEKQSNGLKYTASRHTWNVWNGVYWKQDTTLDVVEKARKFSEAKAGDVLREYPSSSYARELAAQLRSRAKIFNIETLARSDAHHKAEPELWNPDPFVLGTPGGIVDLRTGELRAAQPEDYVTQLVRVTPALPGAEHPVWSEFLNIVTEGDVELQAYLGRMAGYMLTGEIREHALFFLFGAGGNGKGTFKDTLYEIVGGYATGVPMSALMKSTRDRHPADVAKLYGHRLAVASETESGRTWDEARIKELTGGDPLTARFMRGNFFTFNPVHKLLIVGNNQPKLDQVDDAARRRFHMIPLVAKIVNTDKHLREKLRPEYPAILRWQINGALEWQEQGLNPPETVLASTAQYFDDQDVIGRWVEERCELRAGLETTNERLMQDYAAWSARNNEKQDSKENVLRYIHRLPGVERKQIGHKRQRGVIGLGLRPPEPIKEDESSLVA